VSVQSSDQDMPAPTWSQQRRSSHATSPNKPRHLSSKVSHLRPEVSPDASHPPLPAVEKQSTRVHRNNHRNSTTAFRVIPSSSHQTVRTCSAESIRHTGREEQLAKVFVVCCKCAFFHDLPSKVYETMTRPPDGRKATVCCPWCRHPMSTQCCAGYAAIVHLQERLH
jgi:hypothetical protein